MFTKVLFFCLLHIDAVSVHSQYQPLHRKQMSQLRLPIRSRRKVDASTEEATEEEKDPESEEVFLALPFVITEPAIGEGLGAGLIYFHRETRFRSTQG